MLRDRDSPQGDAHTRPRNPGVSQVQSNGSRWRVLLWLSLSAALLAIGTALVQESVAVAATTWMHMYNPSDFPTLADMLTFLRELRVPIPPVIAALEILSVQRTGSNALVTESLYRTSLVGSYVVALWLTYPSLLRLCAAFLTSVLFLWATTLMHPLNPQVYDVVLPLCMLAFLALVRATRAVAARPRASIALAAAAGCYLSLAELSRPFVFLMLPFLLIGTYLFLRPYPRRVFIALVIPIGLLTGVWHLHLVTAHGQLLATNYAGFNLRRAWPQAPLPASMYETSSQPAPAQRWPNINTKEQHVASQLLQRVVFSYVFAHPADALRHAVGRVVLFARPQTTMYGGTEPPHRIMAVYKVAVPAAVLLLFGNLVALGWYAVRARTRFYLLLGYPANLLLLFAGFTFLALSLGEANEEARLIVTVLPFLAAIPMATPVIDDTEALGASD